MNNDIKATALIMGLACISVSLIAMWGWAGLILVGAMWIAVAIGASR